MEEARLFRLQRHALSVSQIERLARDLPLPQLRVPQLESEEIGPAEIEHLASALAAAIGELAPEASSG